MIIYSCFWWKRCKCVNASTKIVRPRARMAQLNMARQKHQEMTYQSSSSTSKMWLKKNQSTEPQPVSYTDMYWYSFLPDVIKLWNKLRSDAVERQECKHLNQVLIFFLEIVRKYQSVSWLLFSSVCEVYCICSLPVTTVNSGLQYEQITRAQKKKKGKKTNHSLATPPFCNRLCWLLQQRCR